MDTLTCRVTFLVKLVLVTELIMHKIHHNSRFRRLGALARNNVSMRVYLTGQHEGHHSVHVRQTACSLKSESYYWDT